MVLFAIFYGLTAALAVTGNPLHIRDSSPTVQTSSGLVHGFISPSFPEVEQFLGIPFAAPPTGQLRFAPPVPLKNTSRVVVANKQPPACLQAPTPPDIINVMEPGFFDTGSQSEDCLSLSIYKPCAARKGNLLPVVVFVFGGAFVEGGLEEDYEIPTPWVQRTQNLLVVKIPYRLNIFGFPNAAGLKEQNVGFLDQRLAIEWIKENIERFGGDPTRITLWGQSAGAISADIYTYTYASNPLIAGHISTSGSALISASSWQSEDYTHSNFSFVASSLGCKASTAAEELACMRRQSGKAIQEVLLSPNTTLSRFQPVADGITLAKNYTQLALQGSFANLPAIYGTNRNEGELQASTLSKSAPNQLKANAITIIEFLCPAVESARIRHQVKPDLPTYRYEYAGNFSNISPLPWMGAYHASVLPLIFGTHDVEAAHPGQGPSTPFEYTTSHRMQDLWQAFAANPAGKQLQQMGWTPNLGGELYSRSDAVMLFAQQEPQVQSKIEYRAKHELFCSLLDRLPIDG